MTVVVDLGCYPLGQSSVEMLIDELEPEFLYGFDPNPRMADVESGMYRGCGIRLERAAAWTFDGHMQMYEVGTTRATLLPQKMNARSLPVRVIDFSNWLGNMKAAHDFPHTVVKMDIEGAEYAVLEALILDARDGQIDQLLVEWHQQSGWERRRDRILGAWAGGEIREWQ